MRRPVLRRTPRSTSRTASRTGAALAVAGLLGALAFGAATPAQGDAIDDRREAAEQEQAENQQARDDAEEALEGLEGELGVVSDRILEIQAELPGARLALAEANDEVAKAKREAAIVAGRLKDAREQATDLRTTIDQDSDEATRMREAIGQMAREAYRGGGDLSSVTMILDADSSEDFVERADLMSQALRTRAQVLDDLQATESGNRNSAQRLGAVKDRIGELKAEADAKLAESKVAQTKAAEAKQKLEDLEAENQAKQDLLLSKKDEIDAKLAEIDAQADQIEQDLKDAIADQTERDRERERERQRQEQHNDPPAATTGRYFVNPTQTNPIYVTSEYGMRFHPILHYWRLHAGIDLRDYCGNDVYAGRSGTVLWTQYRSGYGNQVMITHGSINGHSVATSYNHLTSFVVSPGQYVKAGQLIARAGNTGTSAACHLHFEVYIDGATTNPRPYLGI
ncbi:peptidoglycan DD-metalloendopeptidase family protein [Cellulomonas sp. DKR-3]|uniref:Peptidoglycan DD-metalloendopeptidase family protein n=1 Tax=Cellulomonas fulva TaxID=2835530 RepID=A0ABS5U2A8_9CELL|nr:M23 family metallopeptidase [Cellulomonas fulva]MBT0995511.1 peptidoglycan DD-metalloendopeptidase family protein [Cellulomonas fulva]